MLVPRENVLFAKCDSTEEEGYMEKIRKWIESEKPARDTTTHWWQTEIPPAIKRAVTGVGAGPTLIAMFRDRFPSDAIVPLPLMNEIYVSKHQTNISSDGVFYAKHIDGPFFFFPRCHVFRTIVALNENRQVKTIFPLSDEDVVLTTGDAVAFDFNRTVHYIADTNETNESLRSTLKLHYLVCPRILYPVGAVLAFLTVAYDRCARALFNSTKKPRGMLSRAGAALILATTKYEQVVETYVGRENLYGLLLLSTWVTPSTFFHLTSFVHYAIYIAVYHQYLIGEGSDVDFYVFKRNATVYKALSMAQLLWRFFSAGPDAFSTATACLGFGISALAAARIGMDRTLFGAELGRCAPRWIGDFPYSVIPHPMLVSNLVGLAGIHRVVRHTFPHVVPVHFILYLAHLVQETNLSAYTPTFSSEMPIAYLATLWMMANASLLCVVSAFTVYSFMAFRLAWVNQHLLA